MGLLFRVAEPTAVDGIRLGPNGEFFPIHKGQPIQLSSADVQLSYSRPTKSKVLFRAPIDPLKPNVDPNAPLLAYQSIYAVDTNTRSFDNEIVSVTCVAKVVLRREAGGSEVSVAPAVAFELRNVRGDPERVGWRMACETLMHAQDYRPDFRLAVIVDSSLGDLVRINERQAPVIDDWQLPSAFTLLFASADSPTSSIANHAIATCDKQSTALLRFIQEGFSTHNLREAAADQRWTHIRQWTWLPPTTPSR